MKIVQIIPAFVTGGAEVMCETLSKSLCEQNCEVIVVSLFTMKTPITERLEKSGIKVIYLDKRKGYDISQIWKLFKLFKKEQPDVVHMHLNCTGFVIPAAIMAGIKKRIYTLHHIAEKDGGKLNKFLNYFFIHLFNMVPVALTETNKDTIVKVYKERRADIPVVLNGVNLANCILKENYKINDVVKIIHIGRFEEPKNHTTLIKAFKQVVENSEKLKYRLTLIGTGTLLLQIKNQITEMGIDQQVDIIEGKDSCFDDLGQADIFILPSKWEGMPMSLIEAMGTGLPCIATNVGGIPDMIEHEKDGILINPSVDELAKAIEKLSNDFELRQRIGRNAHTHSAEYSSENMAKDYIRLYEGEKL